MSDEHRFTIQGDWDPTAKEGHLTSGGGVTLAHDGASSLGGRGLHVNPEELLIGAVTACFVQTWAIFLEKLRVPIDKPVVGASCVVEKDPAGGFRVTAIELRPRIPAALYEERRADVDKTLSLAEKYCIVSKAVRGGDKAFAIVPKLVSPV